MQVAIPESWDGWDAIEEQAEVEGRPEYVALLESIQAAQHRVQGRGRSVILTLRDAAELGALLVEAQYQDRYWNTDDYGVWEGGSRCPTRARAAKVTRERIARLVAEATA